MNEDVIGLVAVILLFGGGTLFLLSISPIGKALAAKMLGRSGAPLGDEAAEELKELRREVAELGERGLHGAVARETARAAPPPRELMG